jgi:ABC-type xylose transport system permease subunit
MDLNGVNTNKQYLVSGGILLAAVLFDKLKQKWS